MEDLELWYSIAQNLTANKEELQSELGNADKLLNEIKTSIKHSQEKLVLMLSQEHIAIEEVNLQEQNLTLITRLFARKRNSLVNTAAKHCLQYFQKLNSSSNLSEVCLKSISRTAEDLLKLVSQGSQDQVKQDLRDNIYAFLKTAKGDKCNSRDEEDSVIRFKRFREQKSF